MFLATHKPRPWGDRELPYFRFIAETQEKAIAEMERRGVFPNDEYRTAPRVPGALYAQTQGLALVWIEPVDVI